MVAFGCRGALAAAADSLGRVLLIDTACMAVVRVWKAYRSAQMAWLVLPSHSEVLHTCATLGTFAQDEGLFLKLYIHSLSAFE